MPKEPEILEAVIKVTVQEGAPFTLREEVANGKYRDKPCQLDRSVSDGTHWIIYEGKTYELDMVNIMVAVLDQTYIKENRGKR